MSGIATRGWEARRHALWVALLVVVVLLVPEPTRAEGAVLPMALEASLVAKILRYDRNFSRRAGERVKILIFFKTGNVDSTLIAERMRGELGRLPDMGGLPHEETVISYTGAPQMVALCRAGRPAAIVFGPGFDADLDSIRAALDGLDVMSVTTVPEYVPRGIVFGFDIVSGRPKMLVHLTQAKRQNVAFQSEALKLMRVYQ